jgi:DNA-binding MarR family transcriptional regulator
MKIEDYLEQVFSEKHTIQEFSQADRLPIFLRNEYLFFECKIHGVQCVLLKMQTERILPDKILKHLSKLRELGAERAVLMFDDLRSYQRKNLVTHRIPFIVPGKQIYLPFICLDFNEIVTLKQLPVKQFTAVMQCVFIAILHQQGDAVMTTDLRKKLGISAASVSRVLRQLASIGLVEESGKATRKQYRRIATIEFWEKGRKHLMDPVQKTIYLKELPQHIKAFYSRDSALSRLSMLSEPSHITYAISKASLGEIPAEDIFQMDEIDGHHHFCEVEIWKYDPGLFAQGEVVDRFSLYAAYPEHDDPRMEIELEAILKEVLCEV